MSVTSSIEMLRILYISLWIISIIFFSSLFAIFTMAIYYCKRINQIIKRLTPYVKDEDKITAFIEINPITPFGREIGLLHTWYGFIKRARKGSSKLKQLCSVFDQKLTVSEKKYLNVYGFFFRAMIISFLLLSIFALILKYFIVAQ